MSQISEVESKASIKHGVGRHKISDINLIYDTLKLSKLIADTLKIFSVPFIKQWRNL
jgi:hypothetical protein